MNDGEERNNKRPGKEENIPTASFSDSVKGPGGQIGQFRIERELGRGGAGVVYLAHDTKLDRPVAIKSLPAEVMENPKARSRFAREARVLASLNHPNIATIHEQLEEAEGVGYLVLEYVPGQTLAERIASGPLKLQETLTIVLQIAEAVAAAHEHDVIHRDLKPGNIKITPEGKVKVLDFGLAKVVGGQTLDQQTTITQPGRVIGTPAYMSPEQARGKPTDKRSDIWSFGCVLYEMLTGHLPFEGETATDTLARIIEREPDWEVLPQDTPMNIRTLLRRCLEKNLQRRLRDIGDAAIEIKETLTLPATATTARPAAPVRTLRRWPMLMALAVGAIVVLLAVVVGPNIGRWLGGARPGQIKSLAVLPLDNLSGDPEQEYFADGMTDALITNLSKIGALRVISRQSVMRYKGSDKSLPQIARELHVDAVVEGSVLRAGHRVRITAQLIGAMPERHLWADNYDRDLGDILTLSGEIARTIAREIKVALTPTEEMRVAGAHRVNPETYEAYLKGMFYSNKFTPEGFEKGLAYINQAIDSDPADPLAYAGLAAVYTTMGHDPRPPSQALPRAKAAALKALELDETLAEAHAALAEVRMYYDWDLAGAERSFRRALELNPNLAMAHGQYAWFLTLFGRWDEALAEQKRAQELDPLAPVFAAWQGWMYLWLERYEDAMVEARKSLELNPDFPIGHYVMGTAYAEKGMYEESIAAHKKAGAASPGWRWGLGVTYALAGRNDEARMVLDELEKEVYQWDTWGLAEIYVTLGDKDEAFRWLEAAYEQRHSYIPWLNEFPAFKPLHDDPRFQELLRRLNFPE